MTVTFSINVQGFISFKKAAVIKKIKKNKIKIFLLKIHRVFPGKICKTTAPVSGSKYEED